MKRARRNGLMIELRREIALFVRVCLLILAVPLVHPLAEARAQEHGSAFIICTEFGATRAAIAADDDRPIGAADDCPCGLLCTMGAAFGAALPAGDGLRAWVEPERAISLSERAAHPRAEPFVWLRPPGRAPPIPS